MIKKGCLAFPAPLRECCSFRTDLIHQVDHKHWERSDLDQRPVSGAERHVPDPPVNVLLTFKRMLQF